jgi:hypothetical protein
VAEGNRTTRKKPATVPLWPPQIPHDLTQTQTWPSAVGSQQPLISLTNSVALSPQANYTDRATDTCRRNLVPTFVDRGVSRGQRGGSPTVVNLSVLDRSLYFFFQVAPHLSSQGLIGPRSRPTATQKMW